MARLLADENIHPELARLLLQASHDVVGVAELELRGAADEDVLNAAIRENRILLTADKDFGRILEFGLLSGRGRVLLLRYELLDWPVIASDLRKVLNVLREEFEKDPRLLVVLSEGRYRIRHAPSS